jgi:PDZ domain
MLLQPLPPRRHVASLYHVAMVVMTVLPSCAWPQSAPPSTRLDNSGAVGIVVRQLFSDSQPNHRGVLAVLHVFEDSPAAKAGIRCSDFIIAVNGVATPGRDGNEILNKELQGPIGDAVRVTVLRYDGSQSEVTLSYAPYLNPSSDPFVYSLPGDWTTDPRWVFPLPACLPIQVYICRHAI